jgi:transposase
MRKRTRRTFAPEFKAEVVLAVLTGAQSQAELCRQHGLKPELVALWKKTFLERLPALFAGEVRDGQDAARVAELERLVGRLTLELEVAKKASALLPSVLGSGGRS